MTCTRSCFDSNEVQLQNHPNIKVYTDLSVKYYWVLQTVVAQRFMVRPQISISSLQHVQWKNKQHWTVTWIAFHPHFIVWTPHRISIAISAHCINRISYGPINQPAPTIRKPRIHFNFILNKSVKLSKRQKDLIKVNNFISLEWQIPSIFCNIVLQNESFPFRAKILKIWPKSFFGLLSVSTLHNLGQVIHFLFIVL